MNNEKPISHGKILEIFDHLAPVLSDKIGSMIHLVRVAGPRWSYVAGYVPDELPYVAPVRVMLDDEWAIIYYPDPGRKIDPDSVKALFMEALEKDDDS